TAAYSPIPYLVIGALAMGMQVLAGHIEITLHVLLISAFYALGRLFVLWREQKTMRPALRLTAWLTIMMLLGLGLGAIQLIPFYEIGRANFREGAVSFAEVRSWALPYRRIISFFIPNFFGSPAHHGFFDLVSRQWQPLGLNAHGQINPLCPNCTHWDIKNAVEAGAYTSILALTLAGYAIVAAVGQTNMTQHVRRLIYTFAVLMIISLLFIFGTPAYAILFYGVPFMNQLHTPFRWIYAFTLSIAVLAGLGLAHLSRNKISQIFTLLLLIGGVAGLVGAIAIFFWPGPFIPLSQFVFDRSGLAQNAFADGQQFLSYQWPNMFKFFLFVFLAGLLFWLVRRLPRHIWPSLAVVIVALDLLIANADFNPATDPGPLDFTPPAVAWLKAQQASDPYFRITSFEGENNKIFDANTPMDERIFDVRGYDSVIAKQYLDFMQLIQTNGDWLHNRIGPVYDTWAGALDSALLDLLG
ncbi:MAG: YfhO family protein, partial [Phycisphaerae bacterium]|nr:YfhO family protein [Phycisphaerae bacterium]NIX27747.1 hypothetical protein [Phycisphaerae bacterium]